MSLETPTWDKIESPLGSTTKEFGGNWGNLISDYFNGTNIALLDASKIPIIGTLTRYKFEKLGLFDSDQSHYISFSVDDIDTGANRKIKFRRMNTPYEEDYAVLEGLVQTLLNKNIDSDLNNITNIVNADIKAAAGIVYSKLNLSNSILNADINSSAAIVYSKLSLTGSILNTDINASAAIAWTKLDKTGSILDDIADVVITTAAQYNIIMRNGSNQWINLAKGSNSTALTVDASGVLAYTTITNAMLAGSIAYSKLTLSNSIVNTDIASAAAIAYSKLNLATSIINADISTSAAIAYSKLNLATSIVNADISGSAAIVTSKLADSANFLLKTLDNSFGAHYFDITRIAAPGNPAANDVRIYPKQIDANNDGLFCKVKKAGGFVEVQIV